MGCNLAPLSFQAGELLELGNPVPGGSILVEEKSGEQNEPSEPVPVTPAKKGTGGADGGTEDDEEGCSIM